MRNPSGRRVCAAALLLLLMSTLAPSRAVAGDPDWADDTADGWRKMVAYGRCALQVFAAVTPVQWAAAFMDCGRLYLDEPASPAGGA
jgi:hypothetical protein